MTQKLINELVPGELVLGFFILRKKEIRVKKSTNETYLSLEFGDKSGRIRGTLWKNVHEFNKTVQIENIVKAKGRVITFHEQNHISIENIRKSNQDDKINPQQFLPTASIDIEEQFSQLKKILTKVENIYLKKLIDLFIADQLFCDEFCNAPGGKLWHHAYLGGLLEHTCSVVQLALNISKHYNDELDTDILLTSAFLHDIGKISEFSTEGFINYSTSGRLLGHITIGSQIISERTGQIPEFPVILKDQLIHCILSHHGKKDRGSPVEPMTIEALILNSADELDSSVAAFQRIKLKEKEPGKVWSNYVNLIDRFIYLGED